MKEINDYIRISDVLYPLSGLAILKTLKPEVLENATIRGTKVHEYCAAIMNGLGIGNVEAELQGYMDSFNQWMPKTFLEEPARFFCDKYNITGLCDGIYVDGKDLVLFDWKTPVNESKTWRLQGSAYAYLARQAGYNISRVEFIKLNKDGSKPKIYVYEEDFDFFLKCLEVYKYFFKSTKEDNPLDYL